MQRKEDSSGVEMEEALDYKKERRRYLRKLEERGVSYEEMHELKRLFDSFHLEYFSESTSYIFSKEHKDASEDFLAYYRKEPLSKREEGNWSISTNSKIIDMLRENTIPDTPLSSENVGLQHFVNEVQEEFISGYREYLSGKYLQCRERLNSLIEKVKLEKRSPFGCWMHMFSLGCAAAHMGGMYYDALWFSESGEKLSQSRRFVDGIKYFQEMKCIIKHYAGVSCDLPKSEISLISRRVHGYLNLPVSLEGKMGRCLKYGEEQTLLRDLKIYDSRECDIEQIKNITEYIKEIKEIEEICMKTTPLMIYSIKEYLSFGLFFTREGKAKMSIIRTNIRVKDMLKRMQEINMKNREVLKRKCFSEKEKEEWWRERRELDEKIEEEIKQINRYVKKFMEKKLFFRKKIALIIEDQLGNIPFEMCAMFKGHGVYRTSSLAHAIWIEKTEKIEKLEEKEIFYLLNPENNLPLTENRISSYLFSWFPNVSGIQNRMPQALEIEKSMCESKLFLYFGHGGGEKFFTPKNLKTLIKNKNPDKRTNIFLFGCSSAKLFSFPHYNTHGTSISYILNPNVQSVLGALWDVTDKDLDMVSIGVLDAIREGNQSIACALSELRHKCKLKYLNGGALVIYGDLCIDNK
ncbi:hypothetical protein NEFER03_0872 [Nematocida sp. LUAm3]|nr:hypothetical protein NEFER03_0872 [Nematocida sp. LUAm3]KAI5174890.1 hypothetical protein NEFER02_0990 [Nematocida sp. LUAm2]KAI5177512.1 hypothetical protein NEFER01_0762 [Nematocida sp. LUAm1]